MQIRVYESTVRETVPAELSKRARLVVKSGKSGSLTPIITHLPDTHLEFRAFLPEEQFHLSQVLGMLGKWALRLPTTQEVLVFVADHVNSSNPGPFIVPTEHQVFTMKWVDGDQVWFESADTIFSPEKTVLPVGLWFIGAKTVYDMAKLEGV